MDLDPNKTYDYQLIAFDIQPTKVVYNVPMDMSRKTDSLNIALDKNSSNSAATVKLVTDWEAKLDPCTKNNVYRKIFEAFYDFIDASNYKLTIGASGITFTGINPNLTFPQRTISIVEDNGPRFQRQVLILTLSHSPNFTLCVVMQLWMNRRSLIEFKVQNDLDRPSVNFDSSDNNFVLTTTNGTDKAALTSDDFNSKKVVIWVKKLKIVKIE